MSLYKIRINTAQILLVLFFVGLILLLLKAPVTLIAGLFLLFFVLLVAAYLVGKRLQKIGEMMHEAGIQQIEQVGDVVSVKLVPKKCHWPGCKEWATEKVNITHRSSTDTCNCIMIGGKKDVDACATHATLYREENDRLRKQIDSE